MESMTIKVKIARSSFQIEYDSSTVDISKDLFARYSNCLTEEDPDFHIVLRAVEIPQFKIDAKCTHSRPCFESLGNQQLRVILPNARVLINHTEAILEMVNMTVNSDVIASQLADILLRHTFFFKLMHDRCAVLHACGIITGGIAALFVGPSESGKSTIASLAGKRVVLNDETIVMQSIANQFNVFGTPWTGTFLQWTNSQARAAAIFFLQKAPKIQSVRLDTQKAAALLLKNSFIPFVYPEFTALALDICTEIVKSIPCHLFSFIPSIKIWDNVELTLRETINDTVKTSS